jgi:hypothetical protein
MKRIGTQLILAGLRHCQQAITTVQLLNGTIEYFFPIPYLYKRTIEYLVAGVLMFEQDDVACVITLNKPSTGKEMRKSVYCYDLV